jgi:polyhydroxybutyrate depolymerase
MIHVPLFPLSMLKPVLAGLLLACTLALGACTTPLPVTTEPAASADTGSVQPFAVGKLQLRQTRFEDRQRSFWLYIPSDLPTAPAALLTVLHGTGSNGEQMLYMGNFVAHAEARKYVLAAPNALGRAFNEGSGRIGADLLDVDDVGFLLHLNQLLQADLVLDPGKSYLAGFSSGGAMTQRVALQTDNEFSAFVSVSGHLWAPGPATLPAKPLLLIFGDSDPLNPVAGGPVNYGNNLVLDKPAQLATARAWANRFGCSIRVEATATIVHQTGWYQCQGGSQVTYQQIEGLGHFWAGGAVTEYASLGPERVGPYLGNFITTEVIWDYLSHLPPRSSGVSPPLITITRTPAD